MSRTVAIVQARMGSTRLPGKALVPIEGRPMIARVLERLARCRLLDALVVAIPDTPDNEPLAAAAEQAGAQVCRGSEEDVLGRYLRAAEQSDADPIVRITSDCPLIDPELVDRTIEAFLDRQPSADLVCNTRPRRWPRGLDTEVVARRALEHAATACTDPTLREHVTAPLYAAPEHYAISGLDSEEDHSHLRWTVDTAEDLAFVREVYAALDPPSGTPFGWRAVLELLERRPELLRINAHVRQKETRS